MEFHNLAVNPDAATKEVIRKLGEKLSQYASGQVPETPFNPARL
jgi:hypothetical protein